MKRVRASVMTAAACLTLALFGPACATRVAFSRGYVDKFELTNDDLQKTQFYTSDGIVLQREIEKDELRLAKGRLLKIDGRLVDEVLIPANTPGVVEAVGDKYLAVSFERDRVLFFGPQADGELGETALGPWAAYHLIPAPSELDGMLVTAQLHRIAENERQAAIELAIHACALPFERREALAQQLLNDAPDLKDVDNEAKTILFEKIYRCVDAPRAASRPSRGPIVIYDGEPFVVVDADYGGSALFPEIALFPSLAFAAHLLVDRASLERCDKRSRIVRGRLVECCHN